MIIKRKAADSSVSFLSIVKDPLAKFAVGPAVKNLVNTRRGNISGRKRKNLPRGLHIHSVVSRQRILKARSHELGQVGKFAAAWHNRSCGDFIY